MFSAVQGELSYALSVRLKKSFILRAQAVFFGRLCILLLYGLLFFLSFLEKDINFGHSSLDAALLITALIYTFICYRNKNHDALGLWLHFITLIFDLVLLIYFTEKSGYLLSPLMAIHPFITAVFLLLFHNPLMIIVPLFSIPLSTVLTLWGSEDPRFSSIMYAMMLLCVLDALAIFFIYFVQSQEQRLMQSLIAMEKKLQVLAVEQERQRIAREFHDGIGAQLTSIVMQCDVLKNTYEQPLLKNDISEIQNCAIESIDDMRRSIAFLNNNFDITEQITLLCQNISLRHKINVDTKNIELLEGISIPEQLACCRIVQEGLNNALKHAHAKDIFVEAALGENTLSLLVKDNGCGFEYKEQRHHYGLSNLKVRAEQIGAKLLMNSVPAQGTCIELVIPKANLGELAIGSGHSPKPTRKRQEERI